MLKKDIRQIYTQKRLALSPSDWQKCSQSVHDILFSRIMMHRYSPIHIFLPILRNNELDTHLIISTLRKDFSPDLFLPIVKENELLHSPYTSTTLVLKNKWEIEEPPITNDTLTGQEFFEKYAKEDILILVPLLAFDKNGNRVGYGKGYYDSFLQYAHPNTTIMGLSLFDALEEPISDTNPSDIAMHFCVSPGKVWTF